MVEYNASMVRQLIEQERFDDVVDMLNSCKEFNSNFRTLKLFLTVRKNNTDIQEKIDDEITSMLMKNKSYFVMLRYIDKYIKKKIGLREEMFNVLSAQIDALNRQENYKEAKLLAANILKKIKGLDDREKNILLNEIEIADKKVVLKSLPRVLEVELTQNCNLKCKMCKSYSKTNGYEELNESQISVLVDLFKYIETIIYIGGEPLIYKNIETLFDVANKFHIKQEMITNGLLLTKEIIKKIVDYDIKVTLSIDSLNKDIYENIRVGGNLNTLLQNIKAIYEYRSLKHSKREFAINTVLSKWNIEYENNFIEIINFAKEYNFKTINIYCDNNEFDKDLQKKYIEKFNSQREDLIKLAKKYDIKLNIYFGYLNENINKDEVDCKFCFFPWKKLPWSKMYIKFNGIVNIDRRCPKIGDFSENITREHLINNIWNGQRMLFFRKKIINDDLKDIKEVCSSNDFLVK